MLYVFVMGCAGIVIADEEKPETKGATCPKWGFTENFTDCTKCHDMKPEKLFDDTINTAFTWVNGSTLYFDFDSNITPLLYAQFRDHVFRWDQRGQQYDKMIILLKSYGGSYFDSLGIIDIISILKDRGKVVEMQTHGYAMSGGFLILLSGTPGHRFATKECILMWHEVGGFKFFDFTGPSKSEDQAAFYRLLQDNVNKYIAERSNVTKEELDSWIRHREFWVTGEEALKYGFIDKYLK